MSVPFSNTKLRVPQGFQTLLERLSQEILRNQPKNVFDYSANYLEDLISQRGQFFFLTKIPDFPHHLPPSRPLRTHHLLLIDRLIACPNWYPNICNFIPSVPFFRFFFVSVLSAHTFNTFHHHVILFHSLAAFLCATCLFKQHDLIEICI